MTKVVYNDCYGGFGLSEEAEELYMQLSSKEGKIYSWDIPRNDPNLVRVLEVLGDKANSRYSNLKVEEVPAGTRYRIDEYDGLENVMTVDDYVWSVA